MGKALLILGIVLILFVVMLVMAVTLPSEWVGYILSKIISLFVGEGHHIYLKVVPDSNDYGYLFLAALGILGVALVYYGNKLNGSSIR
jgi:hypothetical protein